MNVSLRLSIAFLLPVLSVLVFAPSPATADSWYDSERLSLGPRINRRTIATFGARQGEVWGRWDRFSTSFDFLDYGDSFAGSTTRPRSADTLAVGFNLGLGRRFALRYEYADVESSLARTLRPYRLDSSARGHDASLQWLFHDRPPFRLALHVGYRRHDGRPLDVWEYETSSFSLVSLGDDPIFTLNAKDSAWSVGTRAFWSRSRRWHLHGGIEYRDVDVSARMDSVLFDDPVLGPPLAQEAPQASPWSERHLLLDLGVEWTPGPTWSAELGVTRYRISRDGYESPTGRRDWTGNTIVDGRVFWHRWRHSSLFLHGRATTRFLLGEQPFVYNQRTSHRFADSYGYLSMGLVRRF